MRASAICVAAAGVTFSVWGGVPAAAMMSRPIGLRAAMPALGVTETVHCRRFRHAHPRGHGFSRGCDVVRSHRGLAIREFDSDTTSLRTIQSGTQSLRSGESTRVDSLRRGPDSPTLSGVRPLSSERQSTGSSSSPFSSPTSGSPFSGLR